MQEKYIQSTMEDIKKELKNTDLKVKTVALQKLTYLNMLGFDMSWAAFHVVEVMSTQKLLHKIVGYQAAAQSFNENTDVMLLITNLLKKDLISTNPTERSMGLDCLSNIATLDLARDLVADVYGLLSSSSVPCRKRAALVLYCCFLKYPDALRPCFKGLVEHLDDHEQSVVCSVVSVLCELVIKHPHNYLEMAPLFYRLLLGSTNNWMTMKLLKIFGALTPLEPRLTKKLVEPLKNIMSSTMAKSLLFECITTVCSGMTSNEELVEMTLEHLKDFVLDSDPNLKYLGFKALEQFVKHVPKLVLRFGNAALLCLSTVDPTIRSSALRVISGLVSKKDLKQVIVRIIDHIPAANTAYRNELSETILSICCRDKYSLVSDFSWYLNILVELARVPGSVHGKTIAFQITDIACRVEAMRDDSVQAVRSLLMDPSVIKTSKTGSISEVLEATAWITGEYAAYVEHPKETVEALLQPGILELPCSVQSMYVQAILKVFVQVASDLLSDEQQGGQEEGNEEEKSDSEEDAEVDKIAMLSELADLILAHISQYAKSPDPEVVERSCQLKAILHTQKEKEGIEALRSLFSRLSGIMSEELQPVSGKAQSKVLAPDDLTVVTPIMEEFYDEEIDGVPAGEEDTSENSQGTMAPTSSGLDAATALTEASEEQKKLAEEKAKNELQQHRQKHGIFYLGQDRGSEKSGGDPSLAASSDVVDMPGDAEVSPQAETVPASSSVDSVYSKMKRRKGKKKQHGAAVVIKQDDDVTDGAESLGSSPLKQDKNGLDVNVFAPLEHGEALPSVEAYPTAYPQDVYSSDHDMMQQHDYSQQHEELETPAVVAEGSSGKKHKKKKKKHRKKKDKVEGAEAPEAQAAEVEQQS